MLSIQNTLAVAVLALLVTLLNQSAFAGLTELKGIQNCQNKCNKVFDRTQYSISDQPNSATFEFRSCIIGCAQCSRILAANNLKEFSEEAHVVSTDEDSPEAGGEEGQDGLLSLAISQRLAQQRNSCFRFCKTYNYRRNGIRKGVIEPDKACLMGCVINTCQEVCLGGTTDNSVTDANRNLWWAEPESTGCSIKSGLGYVQNPNYGNPDAGQAGSTALRQCCTNAFNLCFYQGDRESINYMNVEIVARRSCAGFVNFQGNNTVICDFYTNAQNCGTRGMPEPTLPPT